MSQHITLSIEEVAPQVLDDVTCFPVGARGAKLSGAVCLRLPRAEFLTLLEHFPDDEEKIAQAAMISLDIQSQRSRRCLAFWISEVCHFSILAINVGNLIIILFRKSSKSGSVAHKSVASSKRSASSKSSKKLESDINSDRIASSDDPVNEVLDP